MNIAILTIGDELLNGDLADTNTSAIARVLADNALPVQQAVTVGDRVEGIAAVLQQLADNHDVLIVTGGLGPTEDDRTARAAARAFNRSFHLNEQALQQVQARFRSMQRPMHPANEKQAFLPGRAEVLPNPHGTAPGFHLKQQQTDLYFLPGVPREMLAMLEDHVIPALFARFPERPRISTQTITVFGLPEPEVESRITRHPLPEGVELSFNVEFPVVKVKLRARGQDAGRQVERAERVVRRTLDASIVGFGQATLATTAAEHLMAARLTLALAESCTGGLIAKLLTDQAGASTFLERGIVSYANSAKVDCLQVPPATLEEHGAVSAACAVAMAEGVRAAARTELGLAVTGIAGPDGGTTEKPVGTVFVALASDRETRVERFHFLGNREQVRLRSACTALDWLRRLAQARRAELAGGEH